MVKIHDIRTCTYHDTQVASQPLIAEVMYLENPGLDYLSLPYSGYYLLRICTSTLSPILIDRSERRP